jgi:hypothetical protein
MAYIDREYYIKTFKGKDIPDNEFERLADIASDVINSICTIEIDEETAVSDEVKKATAYETELLFLQGGIDTIVGKAESTSISSESLGDYSVSYNTGNETQPLIKTKDGIPVSSLSTSLLKSKGLMCRWAYAKFAKKRYEDG